MKADLVLQIPNIIIFPFSLKHVVDIFTTKFFYVLKLSNLDTAPINPDGKPFGGKETYSFEKDA